jgi:iron uptake system component EfeO
VNLRSSLAIATAALAGLALTSCQAKEEAAPAEPGKTAPAEITVTASDTACELSGTEASTGPSTFVITNNGNKVTEFYVYSEGERVMGEVENISPGLQRKLIVQLAEPGTYQTACKPGMVGDGIRSDFKVTGEAAVQVDTEGKFKEASDNYKRYVNSQTDALIAATQIFVDAVKKGDVNAAKAQFPIARTYYERIEPVAESFPNDLDPRIDLREADLEPGQKWTGFHRLEKDLWVTGLQPDSNAMADQLMADVKELNDGVKAPDYKIDSTQIAGGAQGLLDEVSSSKITGEEDIFSHTDLWDFKANVEGSQTAVASVRPILDERNADFGKKVDQRFADVEALLEKYRQGDGFVSYDKVTEPQRQELSQAIDGLSKEVSQVQGVIAPK